jgi:hypothetical protein
VSGLQVVSEDQGSSQANQSYAKTGVSALVITLDHRDINAEKALLTGFRIEETHGLQEPRKPAAARCPLISFECEENSKPNLPIANKIQHSLSQKLILRLTFLGRITCLGIVDCQLEIERRF